MKTARLPLFFIAALLFAIGCKNSDGGSSPYKSLDADVRGMVDTWKGDPYGCDRKRDVPMANSLLAAFNNAGHSESQLKQMLGAAEQRVVNDKTLILTWFFDATCEYGKMKAGSVNCTLQFFLDNTTGKTEYGSVVCG